MKNILYFIALLLHPFLLTASNYYWVGGTGNWSDYADHWATSSGGNSFYSQGPQSQDNVYFDANSFTGPGETVTIDNSVAYCKNMTWAGAGNNPTLAGVSSNQLQINGSLQFIPAMTLSFQGQTYFTATTSGNTITSGGQAFNNNVYFNGGTGGEWTLEDSLTLYEYSYSYLYLNTGTLNTNGQVVSTWAFQAQSANPCTLNMGASTFNIFGWGGGAWSVTQYGQVTVNAGTSTINMNPFVTTNVYFYGGGQTYYNLNATAGMNTTSQVYIDNGNTFNNVFLGSNATIGGGNTFNSLVFSGNGTIQPGSYYINGNYQTGQYENNGNNTFGSLTFYTGFTYTLPSGYTQTINSYFAASGTCGALTNIQSSNPGSRATIYSSFGPLSVSYVTLEDIAGSASGNDVANNSIDLGDNSGWNIGALASRTIYWIGNNGNWSDGSHWSTSSGGAPSGCPPTIDDNVIFDGNSFSSSGQTVIIDIPAYCHNMTWTSGVSSNPTLAGSSSIPLTISGSLQFSPNMTLRFQGQTYFTATTSGNTITSGGQAFNNNVYFNGGTGGEWTLEDSLTLYEYSYSYLYLNTGTLNTNGQVVSTWAFQAQSANPCTLNMGASTFNIFGWGGGAWSVTQYGQVTVNAGTSTINMNPFVTTNVYFYGGGQTYYNLNATAGMNTTSQVYIDNGNTFNDVFLGSDATIGGGNTFNSLVFSGNGTIQQGSYYINGNYQTGQYENNGNNTFDSLTFSPGYTYILPSGYTQTINSYFAASGTCGALTNIISSNAGSPGTIYSSFGPLSVSYVTLEDITGSASGLDVAANSIDLGDNSGWNIGALAGRTIYWIGNSGNWGDGNHWSLSSGGAPAGCPATIDDNVIFDNNSFSSAGQTVTIGGPAYCHNMTWTNGVSHNPTLAGVSSIQLTISGSLQFSPNMTLSFQGQTYFTATTSGNTITSGGQAFNNNVYFNGGTGGEWTLEDSLTLYEYSYSYLYLNTGTLNTNGQVVSTWAFQAQSANPCTLNMGASTFNIFGWGGGAWSVTQYGQVTVNAGTSTINMNPFVTTNVYFYGGGQTYYNLNATAGMNTTSQVYIDNGNTFNNVFLGSNATIGGGNTFNSLVFSGNGTIQPGSYYINGNYQTGQYENNGNNTFGSLTFSPGFTYLLPSGYTQTITGELTCTGIAGFPLSILSSNPGSPGIFYKTSGDVCVDYVQVVDNEATGGTGFVAGPNSELLGDDPGWNQYVETSSVSVSGNPSGSACPGQVVQLTANPVYGGSMPSYEWFQNGNPVGTNSNTYSADNFSNGDVMSCIMTSNEACVHSPIDTASYSVSLYPVIELSTSPDNAYCPGFGGDTAKVSGGTLPFHFLWNNTDTTQIIANLTEGTYRVTATDADGCSASASGPVIITGAAPSPSITANGPTTFCIGGSVILDAGSYVSYLWGDNSTHETDTALSTGYYNVTVTDVHGCTGTAREAVIAHPLPTAVITSNPTTICSGNSTVIGGTVSASAPWTVTLSDGSQETGTSNSFSINVSPVSNTTYTITSLSDATGCSAGILSGSEAVTVNSHPTAAITSNPATICSGGSTNIVGTVSASGNWTLTLSDGSQETSTGSSFSISVSPVSNTTYTITSLTDGTGCSSGALSGSEAVTVNSHPTAAITSNPATICGGGSTNISGTISASGNWTLTLSDGSQETGTGSSFSINVSPVSNTTYTITSLSDATGCSAGILSGSEAVTVNSHPTAAITSNPATICSGGSTNIIGTVSASGTWTLTLSDGSQETSTGSSFSISVSPVSNTTYTITSLTDGTGCSSGALSGSEAVAVNSHPTANITSGAAELCGGESTAISGTISASGTWTLTLSDGSQQTSTGNSFSISVSPESNTTYTISSLSDATGCSAGSLSGSEAVTVNSHPTASITSGAAAMCTGESTAISGTVNASGSWTLILSDGSEETGTGSSFSISVSPESSTTYTIFSLIDASGCSSSLLSGSEAVTVNAGPTASIIPAAEAICSGESTVIIGTVSASAPWTVTLSDGSHETGTSSYFIIDVSPVSNTTYTISSLSDGSGCPEASLNGSETVTVHTAPTASITSGGVTICSGANTAISGTVSASAPWTVTLSDGSEETGTGNSFSIGVSPPSNTTYTINSLTDGSECPSGALGGSEAVTVNAAPTANIVSGAETICGGDSTAIIGTVSAGAPWTLILSDGSQETGTGSDFIIEVSPELSTTYTITVLSDGSGCASGNLSGSEAVTVNTGASASITSAGTGICSGSGTTVSGIITASGAWTLTLSDGITTASGSGSGAWSANVTPASTTTYSILFLSSQGDCSPGSYTGSETVTVNPEPSVSPGSNSPVLSGGTINLSANASGGGGSYTDYSWSGPDSYSSSGSTDANPTISFASSVNEGNYTVVVTDNNGCTASGSTGVTVTGVGSGFTWTGQTSSDFGDSTNWSGGQSPSSCADNIIIPLTGNAPTISSSVQVGNVTVMNGVNITNNSTFSVCGTWAGGGSATVVSGSGVVILNGSSPQTISGQTQFQELVTDNAEGITLSQGASTSIMTALDLEEGNFDVSAGTLTFLSTSASQCAIIDNFSNTYGNYQGTLNGSIHAERYYDASSAYNQHYMGSPVDALPLSQFGAGGSSGYVIPAGGCSETQTAPNSPYGNVYSLNESNGSICGMAQWYVEPGSANSIDALGYTIRESGSGTLTVQGNANLNGQYQLTGLTNSEWSNETAQGHSLNSGWQLVSNPYLATLQISSFDANIGNQVQIWYTTGPFAGSYQAELVGLNAIIPPFQAFMVKEEAPSGGTFTVHATDRTRTPVVFFDQNDSKLDIVAENASSGLSDKTTVAFNSNATDGFDSKYDAEKLPGGLSRQTLYSVNGNQWMSINVRNSVSTTSTVPVGFEPGTDGDYTFNFSGINTFDPTTYIYLEDVQTGAMYDVRSGNYSFTSSATDNWSRFVLHFTPPAVISSVNASCNSMGLINITQPGSANWNYQVKDNNNAVIASGILNQNDPLSISAQAGTYTLTLVDNNNYTVSRSIVVGGTEDITAGFTMPSTAAVVQTEISFTSTTQNANNYSWNFGDGSVVTGVANPVHTYTTAGTYVVTLTVTNATGCSSAVSQTLTVSGATGIANVGSNDNITMWSNTDRVYVDFTQAGKVDAVVRIFNILGQEISNEKFTGNTIYQKELDQVDAAYIIVSVKNDDKIVTRKLFIINTQ